MHSCNLEEDSPPFAFLSTTKTTHILSQASHQRTPDLQHSTSLPRLTPPTGDRVCYFQHSTCLCCNLCHHDTRQSWNRGEQHRFHRRGYENKNGQVGADTGERGALAAGSCPSARHEKPLFWTSGYRGRQHMQVSRCTLISREKKKIPLINAVDKQFHQLSHVE